MKTMERWDSNKGTSLVQVVVIAALLAIVGTAASQILSTNFRSIASVRLKGELEGVKNTLLTSVDCDATLASVNLATACFANTPAAGQTYLPLRRKNGTPLFVDTHEAGVFAGSSKAGSYQVRAHCDVARQSLVVEVALKDGNRFGKDPLLKRVLDFNAQNINPIFGNDLKLCGKSFAPAATATPTPIPTPAALICREQLAQRLVPPQDPSLPFEATATCQPDETTLSGGGSCGGGGGTGVALVKSQGILGARGLSAWRTGCRPQAFPGGAVEVNAFAYCCKPAP